MTHDGRTFVPGKRYRVRKSFASGSTFEAGEVLVFERDLFSWYDDAQVYQFHRHVDGKLKGWSVSSDLPLHELLDASAECFELLDD